MKNKLIFFSVALFILGPAFAQEIQFSHFTDTVHKDKFLERPYSMRPVGVDKNSYYVLYLPPNAVYNPITNNKLDYYSLARYDRDMHLLARERVALVEQDRNRSFHGIYLINKKLFLFTGFKNEKQKKQYLFVENLNKETLKPENNIKMIGEIDYSGLNKFYGTLFNFGFSPDSSKILVYYNLLNKRNENLKYGMYVFSSTMEKIWGKENVEPEITEGVFEFQKFAVDNNGDVYIEGANYKNRDNYYDVAKFKDRGYFWSEDTYYADNPNYKTQMYRYSQNGAKISHIDADLSGKFIRNMNFVPQGNGKILCAGIYSPPNMISAKGTFSFTLDFNTRAISNLSVKEFDPGLYEKGFNETEMKRFRRSADSKEEWDPYQYLVSDIKLSSDGSRYFMAEQYLEGQKKENNGRVITYSPVYILNDIYIVRLNAQNQVRRIDKISKRQYLPVTKMFGSYFQCEIGGNLYLTFIEVARKETLFKNAQPGDTRLVEVDRNGMVKEAALHTQNQKFGQYILPVSGLKISGNSYIFSTLSDGMKEYSQEKVRIGK